MTDQLLQARKPTTSTKRSRPRYVELWERIKSIETKLHNLEKRNDNIIRQFTRKIRPLEENATDELIGLTKDLMRCFHHNEEDGARSLLGFWIIDNFKKLAAHPFADEFCVQVLFDDWRHPIQRTDDMVEAQLSLLMADRDDLPGQSQIRRNYPDADMFAARSKPRAANAGHSGFESSANEANDPTDGFNDRAYDDATDEKNDDSEKHKKQPRRKPASAKGKKTVDAAPSNDENELYDLLDINKLFRRIARAVHPDREQDDAKKAEKHTIMSECLQARDNEDIAQMLSLYAEHVAENVGELPQTWSDESTAELVIALEAQLRDSERRISALQTNDPLLQLILDRYLGYDTDDVERRIDTHRQSLTEQIQKLVQQRASLTSEGGFKKALEERRDIEMDKLTVASLTN